MKILITGASGMLGRAFMRVFADQNPIGIVNTRARPNCISLNLCDFESVSECVKKIKPNVIIHTAAKRRLAETEQNREAIQKINEFATRHLAQLAKREGA